MVEKSILSVSVVAKGAILLHRESLGATLFLVPNKSRPVINLKCLNQWVEAPHFKMDGKKNGKVAQTFKVTFPLHTLHSVSLDLYILTQTLGSTVITLQ